jgi:hypothetical protein
VREELAERVGFATLPGVENKELTPMLLPPHVLDPLED